MVSYNLSRLMTYIKKNIDIILASIIAIFFFALYWYTLVPTVYSGDSGELSAAIYELGIAHPTGFPLYMLLAKGFSHLAFFAPNFAYATNLFSAFCGACYLFIMYFVFLAILKLYSDAPEKIKRILSLVAVSILGSSLTLWDHSIAAKTYTLTAFFISLEILCMFYFLLSRKNKYLYAVAIFFGLSLGTHLSAVLFVPVFLSFIFFYRDRLTLNADIIFTCILLAGLGLLVYSYLPWSYSKNPLICFGELDSVNGFYNYITQKDYAFKMTNRSISSYTVAMLEIARTHIFEFTLVGFGLFVAGLIEAFRKARKLFFVFIVLILSNIYLMLSYGNEDDLFIIYRYFLPSYLAMSVFILFGISWAFKRVYSIKSRIRVALIAILIVLPVIGLTSHFYKNNQRDNYIVENYNRNILLTLPENAILFTLGDSVSGPLWYLQLGQGERKDVILIENSLLTRDWYLKNLIKHHPEIVPPNIDGLNPALRFKEMIDYNKSRHQLYATFNNDKNNQNNNYKFLPQGILYKIVNSDNEISLDDFTRTNNKLWSLYNLEGVLGNSFYKEFMIEGIVKQYNKAHNNISYYYGLLGDDRLALEELKKALAFAPKSFVTIYNLSLVYRKMGYRTKADEFMAKAKEINPAYFGENLSIKNENYISKALKLGQMGKKEDEFYEEKQIAPDSVTTKKKPAAPHTQEAVENQSVAQAFLQAGVDYGIQGKHDDAIKEFEKTAKASPNFLPAYINLGNAYMNKGDVDMAIKNYEQAIEIDPGISSSIAYLNLGAIYANVKKDYPSAIEYLQRYVTLNPDTAQSKAIEGQLQILIYHMMQAKRGPS